MILPLPELNARLMRSHALMLEALAELSIVDIEESCRHHAMGAENAASPMAVRSALQTAAVRCEAAALWIRALQNDERDALNANY